MQEDTGHMKPLDMGKPVDVEMAEKNPDLVFHVGEKLKVKGGDFRVKSFGKKMIVLEGLPGTRMEMTRETKHGGRRMTRNEFAALCAGRLISPGIAIENEAVRKALARKDYAAVVMALDTEF